MRAPVSSWSTFAELWPRIAATLVGAATLSLLAPPANWHLLHWVAYLPMLWALRADTPRANRWLSFLYGFVGVGLLFRWIIHTIVVYSPIPAVGAVAILALFSAVFGLQYVALWLSVHPLRRAIGPWWILVFPAFEVVIEWVSMKVFLFPYNHGASQYHVAWTWQLASVTGIWGLSYLMFFVNAALAEGIYRQRDGVAQPVPWRILAGVAAVVALILAYGAQRYARITKVIDAAPVIRVAQLQSDKDMVYRMSHSPRDAWDEWIRATHAIEPGTADLVVWPEGACPYDLNDVPGEQNIPRELLAREARRGRFEMAVGGGTRLRIPDPEMGEVHVQMFNSVYFFGADGQVRGHYDKLQPLPFGEYMPFGRFFPELAREVGIGDFRAGATAVVFDGDKARIATPICYEAILPGTCRLFADADLFVVVTNDAWFGDSANPHQHAMLASTRAMELGIPMFRSAYTGVSFVVDPAGRWSNETRPFEQVDRVVEVELAKFDTLYARLGDWFVAVCAFAAAVGFQVAWRARAGARAPSAGG